MQTKTRIRTSEMSDAGPSPTRAPVERRRAYLYGGVALAAIWLAVVFTSIFAPDLVTGTTQDHFPIAVVVSLLAGLAATRSVVRAFTRRTGEAGPWPVYALAVGIVWLAVALTSIYVPVTVSGTDPTSIPMAAVVAPIAGAILTGAITELFVATRR